MSEFFEFRNSGEGESTLIRLDSITMVQPNNDGSAKVSLLGGGECCITESENVKKLKVCLLGQEVPDIPTERMMG